MRLIPFVGSRGGLTEELSVCRPRWVHVGLLLRQRLLIVSVSHSRCRLGHEAECWLVSDGRSTFVQNPVMGVSVCRLNGDEGAGLVAGLLLIVAMTVGAMMWLTIDVDTDLGVASTADDVAFQVARAAAGELDVAGLRSVPRVVRVDPDAARIRALVTAERLFAALGLSGDVREVTVADDRVWVRVHIEGRRGPVESRVGVRAVSG